MNLEAKVKADRERKDFVWVRPKAGLGSVNIVAGGFAVKCTAEAPAEITRAEWEGVFKERDVLEECEPKASPQRAQSTQ